MAGKSYDLHAVRVFECDAAGTPLRNDRDAVDLMAAAWEHQANFLILPIERLGDEFFDLRTRIAGEIVGKFATYRMRVAIVGDISRYASTSSALRDFVYEANRGDQVWFVPTMEELRSRVARENFAR